MFIEHLRVSLEAAHDVFCRFNTVDPHNCFLTQQWKYLLCCAFARPATYKLTFLCNRDRDRISACPGAMTLPPDRSFFKINNGTIEQCSCSFKEVSGITLRLEANNVIPRQAAIIACAILLDRNCQQR